MGAVGLPGGGLARRPRSGRARVAAQPDGIRRQHEGAGDACDSAVGGRCLRQRSCPSFTLVVLAAPDPSRRPGRGCGPGLGGYLRPAPSGKRRTPDLDVVRPGSVRASLGRWLVGVLAHRPGGADPPRSAPGAGLAVSAERDLTVRPGWAPPAMCLSISGGSSRRCSSAPSPPVCPRCSPSPRPDGRDYFLPGSDAG